MVHYKKTYFDGRRMTDMDAVLASLELLEHDLALLQLEHLGSFNNTYRTITRNVRQANKKGEFADRDFLRRFDARFAFYYTDALRRYLEKDKPAPAWYLAFEQARTKRCTAFKMMALGVNAHVNNDIPQVLANCDARPEHLDDYNKVNAIIGSSIDEVIDSLDEEIKLGDTKLPLLRPAFKLTMKKYIRTWRRYAWRNFENLKSGSVSVIDIELHSYALGKEILALPV